MTQIVPSPVREGDLLAGKYRVERVIGSGGMGIVVAARHEQLGQLVAIKLVRDEALDQPDTVERFLHEARAAVNLRSEHVAKVLDVGKLDSGAPYMVMEYLDGQDLEQVLTDSGPMALDVAVLMLLQTCEAVAEAHAAGIVHRDLKPQNLFLTHTLSGSPRLKVLDFGVSKALGLTKDGQGALTRTRAMLGSPLYMAPEQMRSSRDVDGRVDVWALGVVLFELLTQRWPFEAESMPELCIKVVTDPPRPLAEWRPDLPPEIGAIIERCLSKEPEGRYAGVNELAAALEPFAPPLMSRVVGERSRSTLIPSPTTRPLIDTGRPTLPSAESAIASGPTSASWDRSPGPQAPDRRRRRALAPLIAGLLIGATVAAGVLLTRHSAGVGTSSVSAALAVKAAPSEPSASSPGLSLGAPLSGVAPLASTSMAGLALASSGVPAEAGPVKREAPLAPSGPVVRPQGTPAARSIGNGASGRSGGGMSASGAHDDDIPALR